MYANFWARGVVNDFSDFGKNSFPSCSLRKWIQVLIAEENLSNSVLGDAKIWNASHFAAWALESNEHHKHEMPMIKILVKTWNGKPLEKLETSCNDLNAPCFRFLIWWELQFHVELHFRWYNFPALRMLREKEEWSAKHCLSIFVTSCFRFNEPRYIKKKPFVSTAPWTWKIQYSVYFHEDMPW